MPIEITVRIKEEDTTMSEKFLEYEAFLVSWHDEKVKDMIESVMGKFKDRPLNPEVKVKINMLDS